MKNEEYMRRAIELAKKGLGFTNPNPMVGAVIVKDGRIIGEGWHRRCGELHAERNAFAALTESAEGATIYVTLEPCCHHGRTPPCTEAIIEHKLAKVVIGSRDPNPLVSGKGAAILRQHGLEVVEDFLRDECDKLNPVFFHYITKKTPYVVLKYAMTADGKIAAANGDSKWITGEEARAEVHRMRGSYMAIMAGIGTVLADDPMLNVRIEGFKNPIRVVCDSRLRIPEDSAIIRTAREIRTIVACGFEEKDLQPGSDAAVKAARLKELGAELICVPGSDGKTDVKKLIERLGEMGIDSVFVEGGGTLNDSLRQAGLVNRVNVFIAPKILGGKGAKSPVSGQGAEFVRDCLPLKLDAVQQYGQDILLVYTVQED